MLCLDSKELSFLIVRSNPHWMTRKRSVSFQICTSGTGLRSLSVIFSSSALSITPSGKMETVALRGGVEELSASSRSHRLTPFLRSSGVPIVVEETVPTIDLQRLKSHDQEERSEAITDLGRACEEWGFFHVSEQRASIPNFLFHFNCSFVSIIFPLT